MFSKNLKFYKIDFESWFLSLGPFYGEIILNDFENQFYRLARYEESRLRLLGLLGYICRFVRSAWCFRR